MPSSIVFNSTYSRALFTAMFIVQQGDIESVRKHLSKRYDRPHSAVVAVILWRQPAPGVGPEDMSSALLRAVFPGRLVKNKILEFIGPGVENLPIDFRYGSDVMTTESICLSSIWRTVAQVEAWDRNHGRPEDYRLLEPGDLRYPKRTVLLREDPVVKPDQFFGKRAGVIQFNAHIGIRGCK